MQGEGGGGGHVTGRSDQLINIHPLTPSGHATYRTRSLHSPLPSKPSFRRSHLSDNGNKGGGCEILKVDVEMLRGSVIYLLTQMLRRW